jgi:Transcriptional regulatory protein, C terminal
MAWCECCLAEIETAPQRLPPPWFDHDRHKIADRHVAPKVWQVLEILWRRRGKLVSIDSFMTLLYGDKNDPPEARTVATFMCYLRGALEPTPYRIKNAHGAGWRLLEVGLGEPRLGPIEDKVPLPHAKRFAKPGGDKYGLGAMQLGQSRKIEGARLSAVRAACYNANRAGYGRFALAAGDDELRVWRVE